MEWKWKEEKDRRKKTKTGGDRTERRNLRFSTILALWTENQLVGVQNERKVKLTELKQKN